MCEVIGSHPSRILPPRADRGATSATKNEHKIATTILDKLKE